LDNPSFRPHDRCSLSVSLRCGCIYMCCKVLYFILSEDDFEIKSKIYSLNLRLLLNYILNSQDVLSFRNFVSYSILKLISCVWMFRMFVLRSWDFLKMCYQNAVNAISETQILNISWGACPHTPLANSCRRTRLTFSAITYILSREEGKENGSFVSFSPPLKKL
jgi:hypothetical protein